MEERRLRFGSLVEWVVAALGVAGLVWLLSGPVQRGLGPGVSATPPDTQVALPAGVPGDATSVPVMVLQDGREIRVGLLHTRLTQALADILATATLVRSQGAYGERETHSVDLSGTRVYVVCEPLEPGGPMRVAAVYVR